jgi:hypothetical protein
MKQAKWQSFAVFVLWPLLTVLAGVFSATNTWPPLSPLCGFLAGVALMLGVLR